MISEPPDFGGFALYFQGSVVFGLFRLFSAASPESLIRQTVIGNYFKSSEG